MLYVILRHDGVEHPHYDLMFQTAPGATLATWRADVWRPTEPILAQRLADHRADYLTFEGEISGNRGRVWRVEQGICEIERAEDVWNVRLKPVPVGELIVLKLSRESGDRWRVSPE